MHQFKASFIFFLPSQLPASQEHVGDVLVLKAMVPSFIELFWVISQFALDIPETIDNCDRKLQGRLTWGSLLTLACSQKDAFPVPSYSWNLWASVTCPNPQSLLWTLLQCVQIQKTHNELWCIQFSFCTFTTSIYQIYHIKLCFASLVFCHDPQEQEEMNPQGTCFAALSDGRGEMFQHTKWSAVFQENLINLNILPHLFALNVGLGSHISFSCANKYLCRLPSLNCENLLPGQSGQYTSHERAKENLKGKNQQKRGRFWAAAELCRIREGPSWHHWKVTALAVKVSALAGFATPGMGNVSRYFISCCLLPWCYVTDPVLGSTTT